MTNLTLCVPYEFVNARTKLTWQELRYGIEAGYLPAYAAVHHAVNEIENAKEPNDSLLELAWLQKGDDVHEYLDALADREAQQVLISIRDKWLYLLLAWNYENRNQIKDPLQRVEEIHAEFDYPESISAFVRYMPMVGPNLGSKRKNTDRLFERWSEYVSRKAQDHGMPL